MEVPFPKHYEPTCVNGLTVAITYLWQCTLYLVGVRKRV